MVRLVIAQSGGPTPVVNASLAGGYGRCARSLEYDGC